MEQTKSQLEEAEATIKNLISDRSDIRALGKLMADKYNSVYHPSPKTLEEKWKAWWRTTSNQQYAGQDFETFKEAFKTELSGVSALEELKEWLSKKEHEKDVWSKIDELIQKYGR